MTLNTTKRAKKNISTVWASSMTTMGTAREASSHSFRVIRAMARKMDRDTLPQMSMAVEGRTMRLESQKLRMMAAMTMAPI